MRLGASTISLSIYGNDGSNKSNKSNGKGGGDGSCGSYGSYGSNENNENGMGNAIVPITLIAPIIHRGGDAAATLLHNKIGGISVVGMSP